MSGVRSAWIVKSTTDEWGDVYLYSYCRRTRQEVLIAIQSVGMKEGKTGTGEQIAEDLGWEIVQINVEDKQ